MANPFKTLSADERIEKIQEAMDLINDAESLVNQAVDGLGIEDNYMAYGKYGFDQLLGNGNPYDSSLDSLIEAINEEEKEEKEEMEENKK